MEELEDLLSDELLVKIHEIIATQDQDKEGITTTDILKIIDKQLNLTKDEYRNMDDKIRYRINKTQQLLIEKFEHFRQTEEYAKIKKNVDILAQYGYQNYKISNNDYYGIINSGIYTEDELNSILKDQVIFDKFILNLEEKYGINLLLPNKDNCWVRPKLVDIDQYGYKLFKRHVRGLNTLGGRIWENGKYLLERPDKPQLKQHTQSLLELIMPHQKEEGPENE